MKEEESKKKRFKEMENQFIWKGEREKEQGKWYKDRNKKKKLGKR